MPIYEYQCQKCGHRMEAIQRLSDKPFTRCPECKGKLKKLISSPAFQFKGTGWYVTDYAGKKGDGDKGESGSAGSGDAGGSSAEAGSSAETGSSAKTGSKSGESKSSPGGSGGGAAASD